MAAPETSGSPSTQQTSLMRYLVETLSVASTTMLYPRAICRALCGRKPSVYVEICKQSYTLPLIAVLEHILNEVTCDCLIAADSLLML